MAKIRLGVNIDHVATVRNARGEKYPSPLRAAILAEKYGAEIISEMDVYDVVPDKDGYIVRAKKSTGILHPKEEFKCKKVIFSGGVMGSVKLLMECKKNGSLNNMSSQLGNFVRSNSEAILGVKIPKADKDLTKGIAISAGFHPDKNTHIETFRYGKGQNMMGLLTTEMTHVNQKAGLASWLLNFIKHPIRNLAYFFPELEHNLILD